MEEAGKPIFILMYFFFLLISHLYFHKFSITIQTGSLAMEVSQSKVGSPMSFCCSFPEKYLPKYIKCIFQIIYYEDCIL